MGEEFNIDMFLQNLWMRENLQGYNEIEGKGGYKNGRYFPYQGTNGIDVGPGFLLKSQSKEFQKKARTTGFTKEELDDSIKKSILGMRETFEKRIKKEGGNPATLTNDVFAGLMDMQWQLGEKGLQEYNNLWKAVAHNDYEGIRRESLTKWYDKKGEHPDINRQKFRNATYFHDPKPAMSTHAPQVQYIVPSDATRVARPIALPIRRKAAGGNLFGGGGATVGEQVNALYSAFPKEEFLGEPSHHYLFTIPEEQADSLGYLPDSRGHRDDRVKLPAHPSHPSRGTWNGNEFQLTDLGMQSPNYTLFGLNDGEQDPQAVLTYKGGAVIPEITVTPNGNYIENPYDNIIMRQKAKDQGLYYVKNYPVVNAEDEGLSDYFMNHKDVAGMAIGGGANGIDGPRRIVMNPYSDVLKTDLQKEGLIEIEAIRHTMDENNYKPSFELSEHQKNLQKTVFKDYPYGSNDEAFKQSIISRILVGDADDLQPTPEQEAEAARFIFSNYNTTVNQKGEGGTLDTPKKWDDLSFQEKSEMMKIAIKNGVYSLPEIKQKYNEYAEGGKIHIDESKKGTFTAAATKHGMGVQEFASKVISNPEDYSPEMRKKAVFAKNAAKWHCYGGNLFGGGGYKPSEEIKKRISRWEGAAMERDTIDPLSGKIAKKNASFDTVTKGFVSALPSDIRESVLSNQELADNLYSYAYNVGPGNFKKRVVPTLQKYYKGQASIEDIENSMWASGDKKLRGLQRRRAQERAGVRSALWDYQMGGLNTAINNPMPVFMQDPSQVYSNPLATYETPVVPAVPEQPLVDAAIRDAYTPEKIAEEERKDRAVLLGSVLNNFNQSGEYSPFINAINVLTGRGYSKGGHLFEDGGDIKEERPPITPFSQREEVIITPDQEYNKYLNTLPDNQRFTPNEEYDSYLYWQLHGKPKDFKEAYDRDMFNYDHSDNSYHGNSIAYDDNGIGYFIKPKTHDTVKYELDWYNKSLVTEEGGHQRHMDKEEQAFHDDFKSKYDLIDDPDRPNYYRYQPKVKAFGGHLFAGGGIKKYIGDLEDIGYDPNSMKFYEKATGKELGDSAILDEVIVNGRNSTKDYLTEANDNTSVYNIPHREYNQHLKDRAEQGAREAAIWREEHPNLSAWGEAAASIPLAVASVPLIAGGAEALAGTSAGQAASSALLSLSNLAKGSTIAGAPAWAWADAGLTSAFDAHGVSEIAKGNITPEALMEVAPLGQLAKPLYKGVLKPGMRLYNSPLTGNWTKIGNKEYRINPNTLGANGIPIESREIAATSKIPQITSENVANITPEQWTAAQDAAIARGDMTEAQRLRDLHFKVSAPRTKVKSSNGNPLVVYRASRWGKTTPYNVFDKNKGGNYRGFYFSNKDAVIDRYGTDNLKSFYLNSEHPFTENNFNVLQGDRNIIPDNDGMIYAPEGINHPDFEVKVFEPNQIKSADAVTYDDNGIRIPLGSRDNFKLNDIRYGLLPFGIGLTGLAILNYGDKKGLIK